MKPAGKMTSEWFCKTGELWIREFLDGQLVRELPGKEFAREFGTLVARQDGDVTVFSFENGGQEASKKQLFDRS